MDEAEKEYKKMSERINSSREAMKSSYEESIADAQATASRGSSKVRRKTRGGTLLPDIWNRGPGQELPEQFNIFNQCVGDGELEYFCGTIARNPSLTPLEFHDWRNVPNEYKDEIWAVVKSKFDLSPIRRPWVLSEVARLLREFKHTPYCDNFFKYRTLAELKVDETGV